MEIEIIKPKTIDILETTAKSQIIPHFTKDEMIILLNRIPEDKIKEKMLFEFLWRTGVRISEAVGIKKRDLDFENKEITIRWLKSRKLQYRVIPMHSSLKAPLYMFTAKLNAEHLIFPITRQYADRLCKKYRFAHAHKFRHSFAINFLRQSESPMAMVELKDILGHSHIQTTMEYLKVVPQNTKKAIERINFD